MKRSLTWDAAPARPDLEVLTFTARRPIIQSDCLCTEQRFYSGRIAGLKPAASRDLKPAETSRKKRTKKITTATRHALWRWAEPQRVFPATSCGNQVSHAHTNPCSESESESESFPCHQTIKSFTLKRLHNVGQKVKKRKTATWVKI